MNQLIKLEGVPIKTPKPDKFKIERFNLTKAQRLANGSMSIQFIAQKRKFYFTYDVITSDELNVIENILYNPANIIMTLSYREDNVTKTAQVYVGSIPKTLNRTGSKWVWKDITFDLIEI